MKTTQTCPDCGKIISMRFPMHDCKPRKRYRITRVSKDAVWLRWEAFGTQRRGLSMKVPIAEFHAKWVRLPNKTAEFKGGLANGKVHSAQCHIYGHCVCTAKETT